MNERKALHQVLGSLSATQRDKLEMLLAEPRRRRAFQQLIKTVLELYDGASGPKLDVLAREDRPRQSDVFPAGFQDEYSLREAFVGVLHDKQAFPTTGDVIAALKYFFEVDLQRAKYSKAGRRRTITEAWRRISSLPRKEKQVKLRRFFAEFQHLLDPHRSYRELFRILSRSD